MRHRNTGQARLASRPPVNRRCSENCLIDQSHFSPSRGPEVNFSLPITSYYIGAAHRGALPCIVQQLSQRSKKETVRGAEEERGKAKGKPTL